MSHVLSKEKREQVIALGRLGWSLRRIEQATGVRRETAGDYLRVAGIALRRPGGWGQHGPSKAAIDPITDSESGDSKAAIEVITDLFASKPSNCSIRWALEDHTADSHSGRADNRPLTYPSPNRRPKLQANRAAKTKIEPEWNRHLSRLKAPGTGFKCLEFPLIDDKGVCTWPAMYPTEQALKDRDGTWERSHGSGTSIGSSLGLPNKSNMVFRTRTKF
jgi:hypothetical protein